MFVRSPAEDIKSGALAPASGPFCHTPVTRCGERCHRSDGLATAVSGFQLGAILPPRGTWGTRSGEVFQPSRLQERCGMQWGEAGVLPDPRSARASTRLQSDPARMPRRRGAEAGGRPGSATARDRSLAGPPTAGQWTVWQGLEGSDRWAAGQALPRTAPHGDKPPPASGLGVACETPRPGRVAVEDAGGSVTRPSRNSGLPGPAWPRWHSSPESRGEHGPPVPSFLTTPCSAPPRGQPRPRGPGLHTHLPPAGVSQPSAYFPQSLFPSSLPSPSSSSSSSLPIPEVHSRPDAV